MLNEAFCLSRDFEFLLEDLLSRIYGVTSRIDIEELIIVGSGDSYFAGLACQHVALAIYQLDCKVFTISYFQEYVVSKIAKKKSRLIVFVSASGSSIGLQESIIKAKQFSETLILTSNSSADCINDCSYSIIYNLPGKEKSPGIRTFQASLLGLLLLVFNIDQSNNIPVYNLNKLKVTMAELSLSIKKQFEDYVVRIDTIVPNIVNKTQMMFIGSGINYATALFSSAKIIESTGIWSKGQNVGEWYHVDRFSREYDMPVFFFRPIEESNNYSRTVDLAKELGRTVFEVCPIRSNAYANHTGQRDILEVLSPFLYIAFPALLGCRISEHRGLTMFSTKL